MRVNLRPSYALSKKRGSFTSLFAFALSSFAALGAAFFVNASAPTTMVSADATETESAGVEFDPSGETEADSLLLNFTLTANSLTETCNSFKVTAKSNIMETILTSSRATIKYCYVVVVDDNWTDYETAESNGKAAIQQAVEDETPYTEATYDAYVYNISNSTSSKNVIIPEIVYSSTTTAVIEGESQKVYSFHLNIVGIYEEVCTSWTTAGQKQGISFNNIETITIPSSVTNVEEGAFRGAAEAGVAINVEHSEEEVAALENWNEGWVDEGTTVNYGYEYDHDAISAHPSGSNNKSKKFGVATNYCLGSYLDIEGYEDYYQPMYIEYDVLDGNNNPVEGYQNIYMQQPLSSKTLTADAIGSTVGSTSMSFNIDFEVPNNCHVDPESIVFHNIYYAENETIGETRYTIPVIDDGAMYGTPEIGYTSMVSLSTLFDYEPSDIVTFGDYISFSLKLTTKNLEAYQVLNPTIYNTNLASIQSGYYTIRILFDSLANASYRAVYEVNGEDVERTISVSTPIVYSLLDNGSTFTFLLHESEFGDGFNYSSLKELYFEGFNVKTDLFSYDTNSTLTNSAVTTRFGSLALLPDGKEAVNSINLITVMIIVYIIFFVASIAIATAIYLYKKNRYKNDEFRRVNGKLFVKKAITNVFGAFLIVSSLMFIIFRWGFFDNSITVYNPVDIWVIIFTVAGAIALGLFIKDAVIGIKLNRERKNKERLHLDSDVAEDGTN